MSTDLLPLLPSISEAALSLSDPTQLLPGSLLPPGLAPPKSSPMDPSEGSSAGTLL